MLIKQIGFEVLKRLFQQHKTDTSLRKKLLKQFFKIFKKFETNTWISDQDVTDYLLGHDPKLANFFPSNPFSFMNLKNLGPITRRAIYRIYLAKAKEDKVNLLYEKIMSSLKTTQSDMSRQFEHLDAEIDDLIAGEERSFKRLEALLRD